MAKRKKQLDTVYSTDQGRMCPDCGNPVAACTCGSETDVPDPDSPVRVGRETKGRKGKGVTVVSGLPLNEAELKVMAKKLKQRCGTGGTLKDGNIEIQGDHRELLVETLKKEGFKVKKSGG